MAVPSTAWNEKPPLMLVGEFELEALAEEPVVVVFAVVAENTGWRLRAAEVECVVFVAVLAATVVPAPAWAEKVPEAAVEAAVAVVSAAADAMPANPSSAAAAAAAKRCFIRLFLIEGRERSGCARPPPSQLGSGKLAGLCDTCQFFF